MSKWAQGEFKPKNPNKYAGSKPPKYRSHWELQLMSFFDEHPSVKKWCSECVEVPYFNTIKGKQSIYIPDFLVVYQDKKGQEHTELLEVKPAKEALPESAKSRYDQLSIQQNQDKWTAACKWCKYKGIDFRVLTEEQLFKQNGKKK